MMNNTIGEAMARLCYLSGADTKVISYPSDVSLGIGKAVWQLMEYGVEKLDEIDDLGKKMAFLGKCYAEGTTAYKEHPEIEERVREITQDIYEHKNTTAYEVYKIGRDLNLEYFIKMTARLGSVFDGYIFESEAGIVGKEIVLENTPSVYTESDGAVIFEPTDEDLEKDKSLHTRVFINKDGNPTYEAKDTGLLKLKFDRYNPDLSIFVTDSEQGPYFNVVSYAAGKINKDWKEKTYHMTHGRMTFKGQKMSSRFGNTPIVSDILDSVNEAVYEKAGGREMNDERADMISISALKYAILRTQPGKNINFDPETSLSFEGDSGPYLQYTYARCQSILRKANEQNLKIDDKQPENWEVLDIEKILYRLPEIFESAFLNYAPQIVAGYVTDLAQLFNSWYGNTKIIDEENSNTAYRLAIVKATATVIKKSLWALGIDAPEEM
jgi:arginyl-tRNA synthetase